MKEVEEVTACVIDFGTFLSIAEKLAETMQTVYYHCPSDKEYLDVRDCVIGGGLLRVRRLDNYLDPEVFDDIDLWVFPDIGLTGLQRHLRELGKAVWGHLGCTDLELYRTKFIQTLEDVGLPTVHNERIVGLSALADHLRGTRNKWVKLNKFRNNMETFHHKDWQSSQRTLDSLAVIFGGVREQIVFVVQDNIESDLEIGYDGWCIDGEYPPESFQGYEKKNELYLGSLMAYEDLPEGLLQVNEAMAPVYRSYGYRGWLATEVRMRDGVPYFIDITPRMAGQTMEHQLETCTNFAELVWAGANGILIPGEFGYRFAAEATLHHHSDTKDPTIVDEWRSLRLPEEVERWVKLYHYCLVDGEYQFSNRNSDEDGVVLGAGDTVLEALQHLAANLKLLKDLPISAELFGFADLLRAIKKAEGQGVKFGGEIPRPETVYRLKS